MNRSRPGWPLAAVAFALLGCGDSTAPVGTPSTVAVRAYVDVDGSGTFTAGDQGLAGVPVTLAGAEGTASLQVTTDAAGIATFEAVPPGRYQARLTGAVPGGAVLASATEPVVTAPYRGGTAEAEFRFVYNPGSISGRLYRDNNGNGVFDPGVDTPAPGIDVDLLAVGGTGELLASTSTDAQGVFTFPTLRTGSYTVRVSPLPTMQLPGGTELTVDVGPAATSQIDVRFTGNLISPIAEVRAQPVGTQVAFEGIATAGVGIFSTSTTSNQFNVQDASGAGILVLQVPLSSGIQQGDSVRVVGTTAISAGEFLITGNPTVTVLASGRPLPAPRPVTAAQVAASSATDPLQGSLVRVGNVQVTAVSGSATSNSYNVTVRGDADNSFVIRVGSAAVGIPQTFWQVGRYYDVTGLLAAFNAPQVKLRSPADVELRSFATPIGTVRAMAFADSAGTRGDTVTVEGVVHTAQGTFRSDNAFIQDPTGGMLLFNVPSGANLQVGDSIRVTGALDWFNGELEIVRFSSTSPPVIEKLGTGSTPLPRPISGAQFNARTFEGQLIRIANIEVLSISNVSSSGAYTVTARAPDGDTVAIRMENSSIGVPASTWTVGQRYTVVGALSHFRGTTQVKPRTAADVTAGSASVITIAQAEVLPTGDTVTVEGVVTAPQGIFGSALPSANNNAYIQDGTGGIQIFGLPTDMVVQIGDVLRVTGLTGVFSQERQISRFSSTSLLQVQRIGTAAAPQPRPVTGAEVAARTFEGELVRLDSVVVTGIGPVSSSSGSYNVTVVTKDGTTVPLRNDRAAVGVPVEFWEVGAAYDVTGILSAFNGAPQLKFRGTMDVVRR